MLEGGYRALGERHVLLLDEARKILCRGEGVVLAPAVGGDDEREVTHLACRRVDIEALSQTVADLGRDLA